MRLDGVRYEGGAPQGWGLRPHTAVSIESDNDGLLILTGSDWQHIPWSTIRSIRVEPAQSDWEETVANRTTPLPLAAMNIGALHALPKRPYERLVVSLEADELTFDVRARHVPDEELLSTGEALALSQTQNSIVFIKDGSYRWIHVKRFRSPAGPWSTSAEALGKLLASPGYWDTYTSSLHEVSPGVHGPYRLDALSPNLFEPVDAAAADSHLERWLTQYGPVEPADITGDLAAVRQLIATANERLLLPDLGEQAQYEGPRILDSWFLELVLLHGDDVLSLVVASAD